MSCISQTVRELIKLQRRSEVTSSRVCSVYVCVCVCYMWCVVCGVWCYAVLCFVAGNGHQVDAISANKK